MEAHAVSQHLSRVEDAERDDAGVGNHISRHGDGKRLLRRLHVEHVGIEDPAFGENLLTENFISRKSHAWVIARGVAEVSTSHFPPVLGFSLPTVFGGKLPTYFLGQPPTNL